MCALILELEQKNCRSMGSLNTIRVMKHFHKQFIAKARREYQHNRELARLYPDRYMSAILDGMQQSHCILSYRGNHKVYPSTTKQHITGVKQHYCWKTFYRNFQHVQGGTNLAIDILLREVYSRMEYCIANNLPFPKTLLLQIDGGSENTSKAFMALCQLLVEQGIFDCVEVNRLPVGHTHEDIDALFGIIWMNTNCKVIKTPFQWTKYARSAFRLYDYDSTGKRRRDQNREMPRFFDIHVVYDYKRCLDEMLDPNFGGYSKMELSALHFRFKRIGSNVECTYKHYAIPIRNMANNQCLFWIGLKWQLRFPI